MVDDKFLLKALPKIEKYKVEELCTFLSKFYNETFVIESITLNLETDHYLPEVIEPGYINLFSIIIINERLLSIHGRGLQDIPASREVIAWIEEHNLELHIINMLGQLTNYHDFARYNNIIKVWLKIPQQQIELPHTEVITFPYLKQVYLDDIDDHYLAILSKSLNHIDTLYIENSSIKTISSNSVNKFSNIINLILASGKIDNLNNLYLPNLNQLRSPQLIELNMLNGCKNLTSLHAPIDTTISQVNGPSLKEISLSGNISINLRSIDTSKLENLSTTANINLVIDSPIPSLKHLRILTLTHGFELSTLHFLPNLRSLHLYPINIENDIREGWQHKELRNLSIIGSNLDDLSFLKNLPALETLNLPSNQINNIEPILSLNRLRYLNVANNNIIDISKEISEKFKLLSEHRIYNHKEKIISLRGNPLISPPIEIIERGDDAIHPYFQSMIGETEELNEAKVVFLGNGEVGKTSLMKALNGQDFDSEEKTTHGININKYTVPINDRYAVDATIWDFGGQQIMHATHQLFLSRRCVYVLVINDRKEDVHQEQKIDYWLQQIQTFGGSSKVIIVRNKSDMFTLNNIPEGKLKEKYPNIVSIESVSCKTKDNIKRVRDLINQQVRHLPMRKVRLAQNWIQVKNQIKDLSHERDHLPLSQFSDICNANGVTDFEAQMTLRNLLHDLSVVIAFEELDGFDMGILSPHWITDGIYTLINSKFLEGKKGYIKLSEVQKELDKEYPKKYVNKARFIIESMIQFELCHRIGNANSGTYLVPNLLPKEIKSKQIQQEGNTIRFIFRYENLLPPSIIPNLLVRMSHQISDDKRWRTGAIMTDTNLGVQAIVEEYTVERELRIQVTGQQVRDYFSVIRHEIRKLNEPNTEALGVKELVPLNNHSTEFVDYEELIGLEVMGKSTYTSGRLKEEFSVMQLLSGIESREETEKSVAKQKLREGINLSVEVKQGDINVTTGDVTNNVSSSTSSEQSQIATQTQKVDMKIDLKSLKGTADYVLEDLKSDAEDEIINEVDRDRFIKECDRVQKAITEIEQIQDNKDAEMKSGHFMRVRDFLNNALDKVGPVGEAVDSLGSNITKIRDLAKKYNTVASYFGLPLVPEILLM
ncbi:TPA: COR domain-containing protein [Photobacterium damselae]